LALEDLRSVGIVGGTFNPPHLGHLALAHHALAELDLERVFLMPAYRAPGKPPEPDPGPEQRLQMCRRAVDGAAGVSACALEIERGGTSYTADTLRTIHEDRPDAELTFILGADTARTMPSWREPEKVLELARIAIAARDGTSAEEALGVLASLGGAIGHDDPRKRTTTQETLVLEMPPVEISSSLVRGRVAEGRGVADLVGGAVAGYIAELGLYREPAGIGRSQVSKEAHGRR
jgi:nicotinate-nucleotide adenylyltransferase